MRALQEAVVEWLQVQTGIAAVCDRTPVRGTYPLFAVGVELKGSTLLAGGRLTEQRYEVAVTAVADRERAGSTALLSALPPLLLGGIPMAQGGERRTLHPLNVRTEGERLTFTVELCVPLGGESGGQSGAETMQTLHFGV